MTGSGGPPMVTTASSPGNGGGAGGGAAPGPGTPPASPAPAYSAFHAWEATLALALRSSSRFRSLIHCGCRCFQPG